MSKSALLGIGVVLIVLGALGLFWQKISVTKNETVVDVGVAKLEVQSKEEVPIPAILGGVGVAAGLALVIVSSRRR